MKRDFFDLMQEILGYFSNTSSIYPVSDLIDHITVNSHEKKERVQYFIELLERSHYISIEGDIVAPTQSGISYLKSLKEITT